MKINDKDGLAQDGFTLIRNLLEGRVEGGVELAKEVAETLHNFPSDGNDVTEQMTCENLIALQKKYSDNASILALTRFVLVN